MLIVILKILTTNNFKIYCFLGFLWLGVKNMPLHWDIPLKEIAFRIITMDPASAVSHHRSRLLFIPTLFSSRKCFNCCKAEGNIVIKLPMRRPSKKMLIKNSSSPYSANTDLPERYSKKRKCEEGVFTQSISAGGVYAPSKIRIM